MIEIKKELDKTYRKYHKPKYMSFDPLLCVHKFKGQENIEIAGLIASSLAYGRVENIIKSVEYIFNITGNDLVKFIKGNTFKQKKIIFKNFKHRFNSGNDIALLLEGINKILADYNYIGDMFFSLYKDSDIKTAMDMFGNFFKTFAKKITGVKNKSFDFLFPSPINGSACKRLNMYLRWMIRPKDGIDFGLWGNIPASELIIPVDVHVASKTSAWGFTSRKTPDWKMAEEITNMLKKINPNDPLKYDFSICRLGMDDFRKGKITNV